MSALRQAALASVTLAATYLAVDQIAEHKAAALAGEGAYPLERDSREGRAFGALLERLQRWNDRTLAASLAALEHEGRLWIAPQLSGDRAAIYVDALRLVKRIYVRRDQLVVRQLPFPDLAVSDAARREYVWIRLAGTLYHELQHYDGLEDEGATYDREIAWYRLLRRDVLPGLEGEPARQFEWAVDSAIVSALAAREAATGGPAAGEGSYGASGGDVR